MHEDDVRRRFRAALGEPPGERAAAQRAVAVLSTGQAVHDRTAHPRAMALVAAALVLLVLAGLLGPRLLRSVRSGAPAAPAAPSAPQATAPPVIPGLGIVACRLPVIVSDGHAAAAALRTS